MPEIPRTRTTWSTPDLLAAYASAWRDVLVTEPSRAALAILWAQATLECGRGGASCWNNNVGNIMALGSYAGDYHVLHGAPECWPVGRVPAGWVERPGSVPCGPGMVAAVPSSGSRFRAYSSLSEGCADKLRVLQRQWPRAVDVLRRGADDAGAFVAGLLLGARYFTGDAMQYARSVRSLAAECLRGPEGQWPSIPRGPGSDPPDTLPSPPLSPPGAQPPGAHWTDARPVEVPQAVDVVAGLADGDAPAHAPDSHAPDSPQSMDPTAPNS